MPPSCPCLVSGSSGRIDVVITTPTAGQLIEGIGNALSECDFPAVVSLLRVLAATDPAQAESVYGALRLGLVIAREGSQT